MKKSLIESPCVGECKLTQDAGHCIGCLRTLDEIRNWSTANNKEKQLIINTIEQRRQQMANVKCQMSNVKSEQ